MKKIILCLLFSALVGALLGFYSFKVYNSEAVSVSEREVYAIQVGVFDDLSNANKLASKYGALVIKEGSKYRVYVAIVSEALELLEKYYDELKIPYYVRSISVSNSFCNKLKEYEVTLMNANKDEYEEIVNKILKAYKEDV